jgi:WD repeat-containing protein 45
MWTLAHWQSSKFDSLLIPPDLAGGIGLAQMLGKTNIIALVGGGRMPKFAANKVSVA